MYLKKLKKQRMGAVKDCSKVIFFFGAFSCVRCSIWENLHFTGSAFSCWITQTLRSFNFKKLKSCLGFFFGNFTFLAGNVSIVFLTKELFQTLIYRSYCNEKSNWLINVPLTYNCNHQLIFLWSHHFVLVLGTTDFFFLIPVLYLIV